MEVWEKATINRAKKESTGVDIELRMVPRSVGVLKQTSMYANF
jgi:hypothetical protein